MTAPRKIPVMKNATTTDPNDVVGWLQIEPEFEKKLIKMMREGISFELHGSAFVDTLEFREVYFAPTTLVRKEKVDESESAV